MRNHMQSILHTAAIFGAVGMIFTAISLTKHWATQDKHVEAETAFFQQQVEEKRALMEAAKNVEFEAKKHRVAVLYAERTANEQKDKEEKERRAYTEKVTTILQKMEIGRRICLHSHKETWWFLCYEQDDKGENIPNTNVPCEDETYICDEWAVRKGLEHKGEKAWGK